MCRKVSKLILREANTGCTSIKSLVGASVWPPLCLICVKNFHLQVYISPWLNSVAQGWTTLPCGSITCSMDLNVVRVCHCQHGHYSLLGGHEMWWGNRRVIICDLPVCTASRGTSWVGLGVLAGVTSSKMVVGSKSPFFSLVDTVLTCVSHVMFVYVLHNLGGGGLGFFLTHFSQFT